MSCSFGYMIGWPRFPFSAKQRHLPSEAMDCGWLAEVTGDFSVGEHGAVADIGSDLQRRFRLEPYTGQN